MHFRDFCTPAATACPPQIPLNGWARDTTKEEVWRLNLWLKRNTQSMFSDPKQTQWMGKNARQEAGMSPRLTSSCYRLDSAAPAQGSPGNTVSLVSDVTQSQRFFRQGNRGGEKSGCVRPGLTHSTLSGKQKKEISK